MGGKCASESEEIACAHEQYALYFGLGWRSSRADGKGDVVPNTISRRAFVAELAILSAPVIVFGQEKAKEKSKSKDADKDKEEKKEEAEEKKEEAKDKAKDKAEDREEIVDAPGTDHAQDRRKDRRKDAVKKPPPEN